MKLNNVCARLKTVLILCLLPAFLFSAGAACTNYETSDLDLSAGGLLGLLVTQSLASSSAARLVATGNTSEHVYGTPSGTSALSWIKTASGMVALQQLAYGNGVFVAGAVTHTSMYWSSDGIGWTTVTAVLEGSGATALAYGNGVFLAGGNGGYIYYSTDGKSWFGYLQGTVQINDIIYDGTQFVVLDASVTPIFYTSTTGAAGTWKAITSSGIGVAMSTVAYGNGVYVSGSNSTGAAFKSTDLTTWTAMTALGGGPYGQLFFGTSPADGQGYFFWPHQVAGVGGYRAATADTTWTAFSSIPVSVIMKAGLAAGDAFFLVGGGAAPLVWVSQDGLNWSDAALSTLTGGGGLNAVALRNAGE